MTSVFSISTLAIKFDCLFLTIYQRFHLFVGFIFDKLAPLDICFKRCFKSLSSPLQSIKQPQSAKNVVFFLFCILVDMSMGGGGYSPPAPLATLLAKKVVFSLFCILVGSSLALPSLNKRFELCFKTFFSLIQCKRQS